MSDSETARSSVCTSCGKPTRTGTQFCLNCGTPMNDGSQTVGSGFCGKCGHARTSDAVFCEKCGAQFTGGQQTAATGGGKSARSLKWIVVGAAGLSVLLGASVWIALGIANDRARVRIERSLHEANEPSQPSPKKDGATPASARTWVAYSHTASAITGDIQLAADRIVIADTAYPLTLVRSLAAGELVQAGKITDSEPPVSADLYKTSIPPSKTPQRGSVCGPPESAKWMLAVYGPSSGEPHLTLAFFSGAQEPNLDYSVVRTGRELCGTLGYSQ